MRHAICNFAALTALLVPSLEVAAAQHPQISGLFQATKAPRLAFIQEQQAPYHSAAISVVESLPASQWVGWNSATLQRLAQADDRKAEADRLLQQGIKQVQNGQFSHAITGLESALQIYREIGDVIGEISSLSNLGFAYRQFGNYSYARNYMEQVVSLQHELLGDRHPDVASSLTNLGTLYQAQGRYAEAEPLLQQSLSIYREQLGDRHSDVASSLTNLGTLYHAQGRYAEAEPLLQQSLSIYREQLGDRHPIVASSLVNLGALYQSQGRYAGVEPLLQLSLSIYREQLGNRHPDVAKPLVNLVALYQSQGRYAEAEPLLQEVFLIYREGFLSIHRLGFEPIPIHPDIVNSLNKLGDLSIAQGRFSDYQRAINYYQESLEIAVNIGNQRLQGITLGDLGNAYYSLRQYRESIEYHEQARDIAHEIGDFQGEANAISSLGNVYAFLGEYGEAIRHQERYLSLLKDLGDKRGEANGLNNLGEVYRLLGVFYKAMENYQESLKISKNENYYQGVSNSLGNISLVYFEQNDYKKAIQYAEESLEIKRENGIILGMVNSLNNLGLFNAKLEEFDKSLKWYQEGIEKANEIRDSDAYASLRLNMGVTYYSVDNYSASMESLWESLAIFRENENRASEGIVLATLGTLLGFQNQPDLAIVFFKASVEVRESIRDDIRDLDTLLQQSFTDTVADDYRLLADLLLEQGRIPEAQQVLDLLKLEEVREFTDTTRATWNGGSLVYTQEESAVFDSYSQLIEFGQQLYECQRTNCDTLNDLLSQQQPLIIAYNNQVKTFEATVRERSAAERWLFTDPDNLSDKAKELLAANPNSALIYPFVTDDKLWLLWATQGAVGSVDIENANRGELSRTVQEFGELLNRQGDSTKLQSSSQKLYNWLIEPLEEALQANEIEHLIFVHDRVTRYIPMAALFDGEQFLMERYTFSTVIAPEITDTQDRLTSVDESDVLGMGLSQPVTGFNPLPAVEPELDGIILSGTDDTTGVYPGEVHLNDDFTQEQLQASVLNHRVLHIASHAKFEPVHKEESFILLGDGNTLRVTDIDNMSSWLGNLHLVVLSACQTALGGTDGDGTEIAGISSYFLKEGRAKSVLASLWAVNDRSTSVLMRRFYELLASGELTKAQALRQAQLSLLYDEDTETRLAASRAGAKPIAREGLEFETAQHGYSHPYHWAPFVLIGNGL